MKKSLETIHEFLESAHANPDVKTYDDYLSRVRQPDNSLVNALAEIIKNKGDEFTDAYGDRAVGLNFVDQGWRFKANVTYDDEEKGEEVKSVHVYRRKRSLPLLGRRRSYFTLDDACEGAFDVALLDTHGKHEFYMPGTVSPAFVERYESLGDTRVYTNNEVTTTAIIAAKARFERDETLTGFVRIAANLLERFVTVVSE